MLKFYLDTVQYNKEKKEENRSQTKMFTEKEKAEAEFYSQVGKDMKNDTLGGSVNVVYDSKGMFYSELTKSWGFMSEDERPIEPQTEAE